MTYTATVVEGNLVVHKGADFLLELDAHPRRALSCCFHRLELNEIEGLIDLVSAAATSVGIDPGQLTSLRKEETATRIAKARLLEGLPLDEAQQELALIAMVDRFIAAGETEDEYWYDNAWLMRDAFERAGYKEHTVKGRYGIDTPEAAQRYAMKWLGKTTRR